jgi:hypothetical protein
MMNRCPCKDCQERTVGCHSSCQKYIDWYSERNRLVEEYKKKHSRNSYSWIPRNPFRESLRRLYKPNKKGR